MQVSKKNEKRVPTCMLTTHIIPEYVNNSLSKQTQRISTYFKFREHITGQLT